LSNFHVNPLVQFCNNM